jgi:hypothetical protein
MRNGKRVLFTLSTGWAVRNYVGTDVIANLAEACEVTLLVPSHLEESCRNDLDDSRVRIIVRDVGEEPTRWALMRQLKKKVHLYLRKSNTESLWRKYVDRPLYQRVGGVVLDSALRFINPVSMLLLLERLEILFNQDKSALKLIDELEPDLVFCANLSNFFDDSIVNAAARRKLPCQYMVLSWDHLSSKVVLRSWFDRIYVWNAVTKEEILDLDYGYIDARVIVTGIPQYDVYLDTPTLSREDWCSQYGLDPKRKTILFSTMPQVRHDQQHLIIESIMNMLSEHPVYRETVQMLIKCHPFDNALVYDSLVDRYRNLSIRRSSLPEGKSQSDWQPSSDELTISRDCLFFCDVNINIFSTVTIEASMFDKPIVHIGFDPHPVENRIPCIEYYGFEHFIPVMRFDASILAKSYAELFEALKLSLEKPEFKREARRRLAENYAPRFDCRASVKLAQSIADSFA